MMLYLAVVLFKSLPSDDHCACSLVAPLVNNSLLMLMMLAVSLLRWSADSLRWSTVSLLMLITLARAVMLVKQRMLAPQFLG